MNADNRKLVKSAYRAMARRAKYRPAGTDSEPFGYFEPLPEVPRVSVEEVRNYYQWWEKEELRKYRVNADYDNEYVRASIFIFEAAHVLSENPTKATALLDLAIREIRLVDIGELGVEL
jgi:hypothetical protein